MNQPAFYTPASASAALGCSSYTVRRHCRRLGIGAHTDGPTSPLILLPSDVERLRGVVQPGPGNPQMRTAAGARKLRLKGVAALAAARDRKRRAAKKARKGT